MSDPQFLLPDLADPLPPVGERVVLAGDEGRHAAVVRRVGVGEWVRLSDGRGRGVRGRVTEASRVGLVVEVVEQLAAPERPLRVVVVQALAKGDRSELAVEMLTEVGVASIVPWQASRSVVRWSGDRGAKGLARWRATAREAAKQSRRLRVPEVAEPVTTSALAALLAGADVGVVLHEQATRPLAEVTLPVRGTLVVVVGPEGGVSGDELERFGEAGAQTVSLGDGVLRTSTAGVVAVAGLTLR